MGYRPQRCNGGTNKKPCRIAASRTYLDVPVCHIHDLNGDYVAGHPQYRAAFIKRIKASGYFPRKQRAPRPLPDSLPPRIPATDTFRMQVENNMG